MTPTPSKPSTPAMPEPLARYGEHPALDQAARRTLRRQWPHGSLPLSAASGPGMSLPCRMPLTVLALCQGQVVGCASLVRTCLPGSPRLVTCVANLVVEPGHRRQGFGARMVRQLMQEAVEQGERGLFAVSEQQAFFRALGWEAWDGPGPQVHVHHCGVAREPARLTSHGGGHG